MTDWIEVTQGGSGTRIDVYPHLDDSSVHIIALNRGNIVWSYKLTEDERVTLIQALLKET